MVGVMESVEALIRKAAFEHIRRLTEIRQHLTAKDLAPGFTFAGERIPLVNLARECGRLLKIRLAPKLMRRSNS